MVTPPVSTDDKLASARRRQRADINEYSQYVAKRHIHFAYLAGTDQSRAAFDRGHPVAYAKGHPVPASNVRKYRYDELGLVEYVGPEQPEPAKPARQAPPPAEKKEG